MFESTLRNAYSVQPISLLMAWGVAPGYDEMRRWRAIGFLGVDSTVSSSGLASR